MDISQEKVIEVMKHYTDLSYKPYFAIGDVVVRIKDHLANWSNFERINMDDENARTKFLSIVISDDPYNALLRQSDERVEAFEIRNEDDYEDLIAREYIYSPKTDTQEIISDIDYYVSKMQAGKRNFKQGGRIDEKIMLPDTTSEYSHLKRVLNKQGYDITHNEMNENYEIGGVVKHKNGVTTDGTEGGYFHGRPHSEGGIKAINIDTGTPIEVEGGEVVITKDAVSDKTKREFMGKKMTNKEILSYINQSGGGVALAKGGHIMQDGGVTDEADNTMKALDDLDKLYDDNGLTQIEFQTLKATIDLLKGQIALIKLQLSVISKSIDTLKFNELTKKMSDLNSTLARYELAANWSPKSTLKHFISSLNETKNAFNVNTGDVPSNPKVIESPFNKAIYTENFKLWFGDWEVAKSSGNYVNVSKCVDEYGFPEIYFHGGRQYQTTYRPLDSISVFYWAQDFRYAEWFANNAFGAYGDETVLLRGYVNCKNPIDLTVFGYRAVDMGDVVRYINAFYPQASIRKFLPPKFQQLLKEQKPFNVQVRAWQIIRQFNPWVKFVRDEGIFDGFLYEENNPSHIIGGGEHHTKAFAIFNSNQIKFPNQMDFNSFLDDFRFDEGGIVI